MNLASVDSMRPAAQNFRIVPKAPGSHDHINFNDMIYKKIQCSDFVLKRDRRSGENKDVILLGTLATVKQFTVAKFKSGDATFKITPKLFSQVHIF